MSVTEPATKPLPRTRSSSTTREARRGAADGSTSASGTGVLSGTTRFAPFALPLGSCATEPHAPQSGQRPSHFGDT
jgi:hypothetical protein